jgi:hypothetical protein
MIAKLFKRSLGNQKKQWHEVGCNWSSKEQLMWNDIQKQFSWESVISDISSSIQLGIKEYIVSN